MKLREFGLLGYCFLKIVFHSQNEGEQGKLIWFLILRNTKHSTQNQKHREHENTFLTE